MYSFIINEEPSTFRTPELPELDAQHKTMLLSDLIIASDCVERFIEQRPENDAAEDIQLMLERIIGDILDGCGSVDEYLSRDKSVKDRNIGGYIVTVDDGLGSFICPHCGKEIIFLADEKHMSYVRSKSILDICPNCSPSLRGTAAFLNSVFGEEA